MGSHHAGGDDVLWNIPSPAMGWFNEWPVERSLIKAALVPFPGPLNRKVLERDVGPEIERQ